MLKRFSYILEAIYLLYRYKTSLKGLYLLVKGFQIRIEIYYYKQTTYLTVFLYRYLHTHTHIYFHI